MGKYTASADLWSLGVVAFMLLSGHLPFYGEHRKVVMHKIVKGVYQFEGVRWKRISNQAKCFVKDLLVVDPNDRLTADQAYASAWLNRRFTATSRSPTLEELSSVNDSMLRYSGYSMLKKLALMVIAHKSTRKEIGILRKIFEKYDTERNGTCMTRLYQSTHRLRVCLLFKNQDLDGSGSIRYTEFIASALESLGQIDEARLAEAFDLLDGDDSGFITVQDLKSVTLPRITELATTNIYLCGTTSTATTTRFRLRIEKNMLHSSRKKPY